MLYIKNSDGKPSASLTLSLISFTLVALWLILGGIFTVSHVKAFDASAAMMFLSPILALYWGRRVNENSPKAEEKSQST